MTLYEKFGWVIKPETYLENLEYDRLPPLREDSIPDKKGDRVSSTTNVAICYYLLEDKKKARKFASEAVEAVLDYFYGDWKEHVPTDLGEPDVEWWQQHANWLDPFREGLCWSSMLGDWTSTKRIAAYAADQRDEGTKEDRAAYFLLAALVTDRSTEKRADYIRTIEEGAKQKPKLILRILSSLQDRDQAGFQAALEAYLTYFKKTEFKKKELDKLLCMDGSTLLHVGAKMGLEFRIPPGTADHIIRLK